jgi:hypothetical protein
VISRGMQYHVQVSNRRGYQHYSQPTFEGMTSQH